MLAQLAAYNLFSETADERTAERKSDSERAGERKLI